ncbi:urokinase plasminogen activator surface receptor-like [Chanodichthys erythropterus]|uniref:urokinase plasminogen activator surface receptor-like n=1 Tax=Chanodichthys erythropterus TaxID=933992 RepID=UPI00351E496E
MGTETDVIKFTSCSKMDVQISVFLLFILFTAGHSLRCYECKGLESSCGRKMVKTCPSGSSQCESATAVTRIGDITSKGTFKKCGADCLNGSMSFGMSFGMGLGNSKVTTSCCSSDLCNARNAPVSVLNGKKCFSCDGQSCSVTVSCSGTEDNCFKAIETFGGQAIVIKGCVTKSICDATTSVSDFTFISCCEGNMCNGAQSVSQSFLFLCCSLLSYFLLH